MSQHGPRPDHDPLPLEVEQQIDRLSDEFERAWKSGQPPRIEDYLNRVPEAGRAPLLRELLVVEFELLQQSGDTLDVESYRKRFCDFEAVVDAALGAHERRRWGDGLKPGNDAAGEEPPDPTHIGRFEIRRRLGRGGFGVVYLAHDPGLDRLVAIKVPRGELLKTGQQRESFLHEARTAAKLKHPALVTVHEVQQETDLIYIVQEYIEGQNLAQWAAAQPRSWEEIARRLIEIATAIGYVHQQGFYHRDLKPGNILIDNTGHAHVADFGLAVHENSVRMLKGQAAGTPRYMSPEQIRGETHRIDNRTDIWALGVILYELLAGQRPFTADEPLDLYEEIQELDPKSPRTRNPDVPKELERICFKCLAKRRTHRYATAGDLIEDCEAFLATCSDSARVVGGGQQATADAGSDPVAVGSATVRAASDSTPQETTPTPDSGSQPPLRIVPKGLRSFDEEDQDFFLELLPGPRDRDGLPDSIRFWKSRIEQTDSDRTFTVGVMYGPSGCGKSSLVKAGLLPRLAEHVLPVFVEATPTDTELRLLKTLRKHIPRLATEASLTEALAQLREGRVTDGRKVLLVLDQFEQWLHGAGNMDSSQLVRALRQCDGANVQCLILVRDDFWMSTTRFMQALEIPQLEGVNSAAVDLFHPSHARKVLRAFGLAYGRLPEHDLSGDEQRFLDRAVQDLAHDGKVICVQLSLFADMMKGRSWTPASLQEVGGTSGVGVAFLDETFTAKTAPPTHRLHAKAAQAVLKALLPDVGTDIKGQMQPTDGLLEVSGYGNRPEDFRNLLQILNTELRLITPTEPEEAEAGAAASTPTRTDRRFYQLTHDYLVPSLRDWLTRKQKETRRGRAELKLAERAALWHAKPENQQLPSALEYANIRALTKRQDWTPPQRTMMRRARRVHAIRWATGLLVVLLLGVGIQQAVSRVRGRNQLERLQTVVATLGNSRGPVVPFAIKDLQDFPSDMVLAELNAAFAEPDKASSQKLALAYGLAEYGQLDRPFLLAAVPKAPAEEVDNLALALALERESAVEDLKNAAAAATSQKNWELKTRLATLALHLQDTTIAAEMLRAEPPATGEKQPVADAQPDWHDPPLDPQWTPVAEATQATIAAAHGLLEERFAYCLDMPWETFLTVMETLRPSGYRPTRVRPFLNGDHRRVAAVWMRDAQPFQLQYDQTSKQLLSFGTAAIREGLVPMDVASYLGEGDAPRYCALWSQPGAEDEQRRLRVGMTKEEWEVASTQMQRAGLRPQTLHAFVGADWVRRFAGIWSNQGEPTEADAAFPQPAAPTGEIVWEDISVAAPDKPPHPLDLQRKLLSAIDALPPQQQMTPERRLARAKAHYYLDQPQEALRDLDVLAAEMQPSAETLLYSALCRAQLGQAEEAAAVMFRCIASPQGDVWHYYGKILMDAWLGKVEEAKGSLDEFVQQSEVNSGGLYNAACVAAQLARILKGSDPTDIAAWQQRALDLLKQSYALGHSGSAGVENGPDFAPLYDAPAFQTLVAELVTSQCYAGVWRRGRDFESWLETAGSWEEQQQAARAKVAENGRPVAVAVRVAPNQTQPQVTVIWQRPLPAPAPARPWDPVERTMFIEHFTNWSGSVEKLVDVLPKEDNAPLRSGISLALGSIENPNTEAKQAWEPVLGDWHQGEPDSGVHSATGWALRAWSVPMPNLEKGTQPSADFQWRVTEKGLTMIRIRKGEVQVPEDQEAGEEPKTIRIEEEFWLSDCEVTAGLFSEFLSDEEAEEIGWPGGRSDNPALPVMGVSWYDAVKLCNWLSRQEGLQPCYRRKGKERLRDYDGETREFDAWWLVPDANGYRLPTEDQWEYACRALTTTAFAFGDDQELLERYAVFYKNNEILGPSAVGGKRCNAWGLFDMHGNVDEWCEDWEVEGASRVYRGGGWNGNAPVCRSAYGSGVHPEIYRYDNLGFRVASVPSSQ